MMPTLIICKKIFRIVPALCLIIIFSAGIFTVYSQESINIRILRGDKLSIAVLEQEELNNNYTVDSSGQLEFPLITDPIYAEGLTCNELASQIKEELEKNYFYQATVIVKPVEEEEIEVVVPEDKPEDKKQEVVYVYGMVGSPGVIKIPEGETLTVSKVIIMSGGFKEFANRKSVRLTRKSPATGEAETTIVNVVNILHKGKLEEDIVVCDGDIIVVPEKFFNF